MVYEPLHHKYRPQTFAQLVGQEAIATTLTHAIQQQRVAPAYLFTGARGTGKTSTARILAKSLNCLRDSVPTPSPCGVCDVCRSIVTGNALDVIEIDAASNTGVENIRELIERAQFAPVQCRYKVYVLDEVHMLSSSAFNALLKTLEEPPAHVVFVLATTDPQRVLPTIISRCQRFDFRRIPLEAMSQHLATIAAQEKIAITADAIQLVAQIAQGGLRDAESLLDQLSLLAGEVTVEQVWDLVGAVPERDLMALLEAIAAEQPETVLDHTRRLMDRGREPLIVLQNLASFYRDLLIAKTAPQRPDLTNLTPPTWEKLCRFAQRLDFATILASQQHLRVCEVQVKQTTQPRLWLEVSLMGLLPSHLARVTTLATSTAHPAPLPVAGSSAPPVAAPVSMAPLPSVIPAASPIATTSPAATPPPATVASQATLSAPAMPAALPNSQATAESAKPVGLSTPALPVVPAAVNPSRAIAVEPPLPPVVTQVPTSAAPLGESLDTLWLRVVEHLELRSAQTMFKQMGCLLEIKGSTAKVGMKTKKWLEEAKKKQTELEDAFCRALQQSVVVVFGVGEGVAPASTPAPVYSNNKSQRSTEIAPSPSPIPGSEEIVASPSASPLDSITTDFSGPPSSESTPASPLVTAASPPQTGSRQPLPEPVEDEVLQSARSLAAFFGGKVIHLDDSPTDAEEDLL